MFVLRVRSISYCLLGLVRWLLIVFLLFCWREREVLGGHIGFSQQAKTGVVVAHMFFPVHAHVCSTKASCSFMGPLWLIYPILSYPILSYPLVDSNRNSNFGGGPTSFILNGARCQYLKW
jgi:hypothetical protein